MTQGWPVAADYDEAIQNPHLNFDDRELKAGEPEYDQYGSPAVRSGNFASVYMLKTDKRKIAVRCFLREIPDQQERYIAISKDLLGLGLPYTVNFEFLEKGIKIQGSWFPVLKMDWCDGELLDRYLERNLDNQAKVRRLADKWYEMSVALRKNGIAHGDLQHGNVMVLDDELKLIDYDGMFVPRLAGRHSNERGLEHYQHPGRTDEHYGRYLDNFSHWVLYTTLVALGEDKTLWHLSNLADKHLLFSRKDLDNPSASKTFDVLKRHDDKTIRTYATTVENLLGYDVERIPDFSPDKPVLFPPDYTASSKPKKGVSTGGDKGGLHSVGDKGGLHSVGDKGGLHSIGDKGGPSQERDKGHLFVSPQDEVKTDTSRARFGSRFDKTQIILAGLIGLAVLIVVGTVVALLQPPKSNTMTAEGAVNILALGVADARERDYDKAMREFQSVVDADLNPKIQSKAYTLMGYASVAKAGKDYDTTLLDYAVTCFAKALKEEPTNAEALYGSWRANKLLNKATNASTDQAKLNEVAPNYKLGATE